MKKRITALTAAAVGFAFCIGCAVPRLDALRPAQNIGQEETIRIGYFGPLTGRTASAGKASLNGALLAAEEANAKGGVLGHPVEIIAYDDCSVTAEAVKAVKALIEDDKVNAIYGSLHSASMNATGAYIDEHEVLCVSGATSTSYLRPNMRWLFRCTVNDKVSVEKLAEYAEQKEYHRIAAFASDDIYGVSAVNELKDAAPRHGLTVVTDVSIKNGDRVFSTQLAKILAAKPDAVFVWCLGDDLGVVTRQMRNAGIDCPILGCEEYSMPSLMERKGALLNDVVFAAPYLVYDDPEDAKDDNMKDFLSKYITAFGEAPKSGEAFRAYDGVSMILLAMGESGAFYGETLRDAFCRIDGYVGLGGTFSYKEGEQGEGVSTVHLYEISYGSYHEVDGGGL